MREPERAEQERSLFAGEPVLRSVAVHKSPLVGESFLGRVDRREQARIIGRKEALRAPSSDSTRRASSDPNDWVKALAVSLQPLLTMACVDLVPYPTPFVDAIVSVEAIGEHNRAFERDPTHQLRVHEVARLAAYLPDPVIGFVPVPRGRVGDTHEERLRVRRQVGEVVGEPVDGIQQLAVHVELPLVPSPVADPHRRAVAPARQVVQARVR